MLFGGSGRPVPAARSSRLCPHAWGFADEWTLSGVTPAPLARGRGVCCLAGREDQFPPRSHRGYARMRGALPTNGRSPAREGPCLHEGGAFGRGWKGSSHRLDTVATPACVGALPSNGRSPACERPRLHEGGVCLDGTGRATRLSCPGEPSCRKFSSGLAAGGGCRNVVGNGALGGASARAPGSGHVGNKVGELARRIRTRSGVGGMSAIGLGSCPAHPHALRGRMYRKTATAR